MTTMPVILAVNELVTWAVARGETLSADEVDLALSRVGRISGPALVDRLVAAELINYDDVVRILGVVWSMAEYPDRELGHDRWRELFSKIGFTVDGRPAPRPAVPVTVYRGSVAARRGDWSWTSSSAIASQYALAGIGSRPRGTVWTVVAPPEQILAINHGRDEDEYVVDTAGLTITPANQPPAQ